MTPEQIEELLNLNKKLYKSQRQTNIVLLVIAILLAVVCVMIVPGTKRLIDNANLLATHGEETLKEVDVAIAQVEEAISGIEAMSNDLSEVSGNMNNILLENSEALTATVSKISEIDFEGLNKGIVDLQNVVEPLANFMGKFGFKK